ncbi:MAG: transcription antiterminator, partial [Erysipelotrichia bacterium]|nr:transcription antiterminator [Erysipelotrichia bacterium]
LVCSFGLATSSILKTRMEQVIPECIILGPMSKHEAETYAENHRVDIIISTNDIDFQTIPVIKVNPLIYPEDMDYIKNRLFQLSYSLMCKSFLTSYSKQAKNERQICIKDLISPDNIEIMDHCDSWEKAIVLAAKPLLKSHDIEQRYVEKMIDAVNRLGTYMVLVPETAFVHAGTEDGIRCNCTSILILKKPLVFGNKNPKTVRFLVILGIKNKEENALLELVYIFENENNRSVLVSEDITKDMIGNLHK